MLSAHQGHQTADVVQRQGVQQLTSTGIDADAL